MDLGDHLAVPYVAVVYSVERPDGTWWRRAEYPELPGCVAEASSAVEAIERLERQRVRLIAAAYASGEEIPVPRPPLQYCDPAWVAKQVGLADEIIAHIERDALMISLETNY